MAWTSDIPAVGNEAADDLAAINDNFDYLKPLADGAEQATNKDTDGTLAADSDTKYCSQKAIKTYVDTTLTNWPVVSHNFAGGSTAWTVSATEAKGMVFSGTNSIAAAYVIFPQNPRLAMIRNGTSYALYVKTSHAATVPIVVATNKQMLVWIDSISAFQVWAGDIVP